MTQQSLPGKLMTPITRGGTLSPWQIAPVGPSPAVARDPAKNKSARRKTSRAAFNDRLESAVRSFARSLVYTPDHTGFHISRASVNRRKDGDSSGEIACVRGRTHARTQTRASVCGKHFLLARKTVLPRGFSPRTRTTVVRAPVKFACSLRRHDD